MNLFSMFRRAQVIVSSLQAAAPVPHAPTINAVEEYCSNLIAAAKASLWPVGAVYVSVVDANPADLLGFGTWVAIGAGRVLVGQDAGDSDFDTLGATGGEKAHALTVGEMPTHTHVQDAHNHTQDPHTHTQNAHNHTQDAHNHTQNSFAPRIINSGTAGTVGVQGASAASNANASNSATTATNQAATATNQNATATNQTATATNQNATATNQSATATNQAATATNNNATATNQAATATNNNATATNQAATATNQNAGGGSAHSLMNPYLVVKFWKRAA